MKLNVLKQDHSRDILQIAWPVLVEGLLTQMVSIANMVMVGRLGPWALSAVGLATQPRDLMMLAVMALNVGVTALVARYKGAGEPEKVSSVLEQGIKLSLAASLFFACTGSFFAEKLIRFMGAADQAVLQSGTAYLRIMMIGLTAVSVTGTITAALRGMGYTRVAMKYNLAANGINIAANYLLIYGRWGFPRMGVAGAAVSSVLGQCAAFAWALGVVLSPKNGFHLSWKRMLSWQRPVLSGLWNIGWPSMAEQAVTKSGVILYSRIVAALGTLSFAAHQIAANTQGIAYIACNAFGITSTALVGQSLGQEDYPMAKSYIRYAYRIGIAINLVLGALFVLLGGQIASLYSGDPQVQRQAVPAMILCGIMQPIQAMQAIIAGGLRGAGKTRFTAITVFLSILIARPGFAWLLTQIVPLGLTGAWLALLADQIIRVFLITAYYRNGRWARQ